MKIEFTNHANQRIFLERAISAFSIKRVIKKPDKEILLPDGKIKCQAQIDDKVLVVVYFRDKRNVYVIVISYFK